MSATPEQRADDAARAVLVAQQRRSPFEHVVSPPGGGKSRIVENVAVQESQLLGGRAMVATQTNEQAWALADRLATRFPRLPFWLLVKDGLRVPDVLLTRTNLQIVHGAARLPAGPIAVVGNAALWSWQADNLVELFTCQIVDEAYQLTDSRFAQIAGLADRLVLVGDPGQINPVVRAPLERWRSDPAGPHVPCPDALRRRHPSIVPIQLPVSRRLVEDTVALVRPAFYRNLPFSALSTTKTRSLVPGLGGITPLDTLIDQAAAGASIVQGSLPPVITGGLDEELAEAMVALVERLLTRDIHVIDDGRTVPLTPEMIGVVCAHVDQVGAVAERLGAAYPEILVETADRFQGLEREIMIVQHPLSGRADADTFHLDAGRLCVMLSRHRVTCFLMTRAGIGGMLRRHAPSGDRVLGVEEDAEHNGHQAHLALLGALWRQKRVVGLP